MATERRFSWGTVVRGSVLAAVVGALLMASWQARDGGERLELRSTGGEVPAESTTSTTAAAEPSTTTEAATTTVAPTTSTTTTQASPAPVEERAVIPPVEAQPPSAEPTSTTMGGPPTTVAPRPPAPRICPDGRPMGEYGCP